MFRGHLDIARFLLDRGTRVDVTNEDGNTPLHVAAFLCRREIVALLLEKGAPVLQKNNRGETAIDVVSSPWTRELAGFYAGIGRAIGVEIDLERMERERSEMVRQLREHLDAARPIRRF